MQKLLFVVVLTVMVIGFLVLISGDTAVPTRAADAPHDAVAKDISKIRYSSVSAAIGITIFVGTE